MQKMSDLVVFPQLLTIRNVLHPTQLMGEKKQNIYLFDEWVA